VLTTFNVAAQTGAAPWVRARALSAYLMIFQGGLAVGSAGWGLVAQFAGTRSALSAAGALMTAGLAVAHRHRVPQPKGTEPAPEAMGEPAVAVSPRLDEGPVLVTIDYRVDAADATEFLRAMYRFGRVRRRDGAYRWGIFHDLADTTRFVETFLVETWAEHLRQHRRATVADAELQEHVRSFHQGPGDPVVSHLIREGVETPRANRTTV
jgi:hypothetical protein